MFLRICALGFSAFLAYDLVRFPLIPRLAYQLGAGPAQIGLVVAASTMTGIVGKWLTGGLSDHWGRRRLLLIGCLMSAAMPLTYLMVRDYRMLIVLRVLHGTVTAILGPVTRAVVSDIAPPQERGAQLGAFASAVQVGMSAGRWIGGLLLFWGGFRFPLMAAALAGVVAVGLALTWPAEPAPVAAQPWGVTWRAVVDDARAVLQSRWMVATGAIEASQFLVRGAIEAFLPIYALEVAGLNDSHVGMLFGLQLLTLVLLKPVTGWWSDRIGRVPLIAVGLLVCSALVGFLPHITSFGGLCLLLIGYSVGAAMASAASLAFITDLAPSDGARDRFGASHGFFGTLVDIGHASGPLLGGLLIAWLNYAWAFGLLAGGLCVATLLFTMTVRAVRA